MGILELIIVILILAWLFGLVAFPSLGAIIHILLVVALVVLIYRLFRNRPL